MTINGRKYSDILYDLQIELCRFQAWLKASGERVIVVFEGRDSAGKGGMISTITERVSQRVFRTVALPKPSDREATQWYPQRYIDHFPAAGEVTLFDRSWYNRAGVERVMKFTSEERVQMFLRECADFEHAVTNSGIHLVKYWLEISQETQKKRLGERIEDPRKHWKLSPMDTAGHEKWYDYSRARDDIFKHTDTAHAPWYIVPSDDKDEARLNCISHLLSLFDYQAPDVTLPVLPEIDQSDKYDDQASIADRRFVPREYAED